MRPEIRERGSTAGIDWVSTRVAPAAALSGLVYGYTEFRERSASPVDRIEVSAAAAVLIVEFDDQLLVADAAEHRVVRTWQAFGAGLSQGPTSTSHAGAQHCLEVRLSPFGLYRLSGIAMDEFSNRVVGLADIFGSVGRRLPDQLAERRNSASRFDLLDAVFADAAAAGPEPDREVVYAWRQLNRTRGMAAIGDILTETGWSRARMSSRFRSQVGLTPKAVARVLRFAHAVDLIVEPGHRSFASIAQACGYYDQAHFNRDFRELAGCSPMEWIALRNDDVPIALLPSAR